MTDRYCLTFFLDIAQRIDVKRKGRREIKGTLQEHQGNTSCCSIIGTSRRIGVGSRRRAPRLVRVIGVYLPRKVKLAANPVKGLVGHRVIWKDGLRAPAIEYVSNVLAGTGHFLRRMRGTYRKYKGS